MKVVGAILLLLAVCPVTWAEDKPNVILIMTDDQGYGDLSCHGNPILKTPHLDKLSGESASLADFHVSPFCAPTRAALMTGRMAARGRVWTTINNGNNLARCEVTMAEFFKSSGYSTGIFGKWHLGHTYPYRPMDRGFDQWFGVGDGGVGTANDYWANDRVNDHYLHNGKWVFEKGYCNDVFFDRTMDFIKKNKDKPFFAYLATNAPHGPFSIPKEWENEYQGKAEGSVAWGSTAEFFATIARIDHNVGRLRAFLQEHNLDKNTILIFMTDNGSSGASSAKIFNAGMRGSKGSPYEGGHRVPCIIHWPAGGLNVKTTINALTSCVDLLPTLKDLCKLSNPDRKLNPLDGISFSDLLKDPASPWPSRTFILHNQNGTTRPKKSRNMVVLHDRWRLIGDSLYDVKSDFAQVDNVAGQNPQVVQLLRKKYDDYWASLNARAFRDDPARYIVGSDRQEIVSLTGTDGIHLSSRQRMQSWNQRHARSASRYNNYWPLEVCQAGHYAIEVRRWPREVDLPMNAGIPLQETADAQLNGKEWRHKPGVALAIKKVILHVGEKQYDQTVTEDQKHVTFTLPLEKGNLDIKAELEDEKGRFSAYYVYVSKRTDIP